MNDYTVVVFGKDENANFTFKSDISLQSDDVARIYASEALVKRIRNTFVGNWWIDGIIYNHTTGKRVLLRDE